MIESLVHMYVFGHVCVWTCIYLLQFLEAFADVECQVYQHTVCRTLGEHSTLFTTNTSCSYTQVVHTHKMGKHTSFTSTACAGICINIYTCVYV